MSNDLNSLTEMEVESSGNSVPATSDKSNVQPQENKSSSGGDYEKKKEMPIRQYLDSTVVPVLLAGMSQLTKERPETDEIEWLAQWMLRNNPNNKTKSEA